MRHPSTGKAIELNGYELTSDEIPTAITNVQLKASGSGTFNDMLVRYDHWNVDLFLDSGSEKEPSAGSDLTGREIHFDPNRAVGQLFRG